MNNDMNYISAYNDMNDAIKTELSSNTKSTSQVKTNFHKSEVDLTWLEMMEDTTRYINNILMEPKRAIVNHEEILQVEKSKKVTVESVIHLSQHSNLIDDINVDAGDVRPKKVLNVLKEETLNTYENRFLYTLINNMQTFINMYGPNALKGNSINSVRTLEYKGSTRTGTEKININVSLDATDITNLDKKKDGMTVQERIQKLKKDVASFTSSELYKTLTQEHATPVKSPIKKTNLILHNPNFQRCEALWDFMERYRDDAKKETRYSRNYTDNPELTRGLDVGFLVDYALLNRLASNKREEIDWNDVNLAALKRAIKNFIDFDPNLRDAKFLNIVKNEFKNVKHEQTQRFNAIKSIITRNLDTFDKNKQRALNIIK